MSLIDLLFYGSVFSFAFGGFIFERNPRSRQNRSFALLCLGIAFWLLGFYLLISVRTFYWPDKIIDFGGIAIAAGLFLFTSVFPTPLPQYIQASAKQYLAQLLPLMLLTVLLPFNLFIKSADFSETIPDPVNGALFGIYALILIFYVLIALHNFYLQFRASSGYKRQQILYALLGAGIFLLCGLLFDLVLPLLGHPTFKIIGPLASIFFISLTALSIVSYRLMDIRLLGAALLSNLFALLISGGLVFLELAERPAQARYVQALIPFGAIAAFLVAKALADRLARKFFLRDYFVFENAIAELNERLRQELRLKDLIALVSSCLRRAMRLQDVYYVNASKPDSARAINPAMHVFARQLHRVHFFSIAGPAEFEKSATAILPILENGILQGYFLLGPQIGWNGLSAGEIEKIKSSWQHIQTAFSRATLRQNLEARVQSQVEAVIDKNRRLRLEIQNRMDFVKAASHQLRTPVTALSGALQLLGREENPERQKELLDMAYGKTRQLADVISGILSLAKVEQGNIRATQEILDLNEVFGNVLTVYGALAASKNLKIDFEVHDDLKVYGSKQFLEQAFANILENALEYAQSGGVKIYFMPEPNFVIAAIRDTGPGIPPELQPKIFNKNLHGSGSKGLGLGLYLVKTIITAHPKGHIWFETSPQGTTFFIRLKRAKSAAAARSGQNTN